MITYKTTALKDINIMNILDTDKILKNGIKIPAIGFGTWQLDNVQTYNAVKLAIKNGYRHIDTAFAYQNEKSVGKVLKDLNIDRKKVFITTKIPAEIKNYKDAQDCFYKSLYNMETEYIDLLLIHAPKPWKDFFSNSNNYDKENIEVWNLLEKVYKDGKVKAIGVSNFDIKDLENIINNCEIKPAVNQIRFFIGFYQKQLIDYCQSKEITVVGHSTFTAGKIFENKDIKNIALKNNVTVAQLCIKYAIQKNIIPLIRTTKQDRMIENIKIDFDINDNDISFLEGLQESR